MNQTHAALPDVGRNRLASEKSPYLLQHASNPVDWYPWGDEAFATARSEDKPVFLSIGYATCHWCHVMAHESFEDEEIAALLNEAFVCVKVDREERPDIDAAYMAVCQAMTGLGGWPLSVVMTADGAPFFAATYLPPRARHGLVGLIDLIPKIKTLWRQDRSRLLDVGRQAIHAVTPVPSSSEEVSDAVFNHAYAELSRRFDERHGGFGDAPKFPTPHTLLFLLRHWSRTGQARALAMVETTLTAMRHGGIYDQIGFGFHRYSTDSRWLVPHFEKMLYDQALLTMAYTEAALAMGDPLFRATAGEIIDYVLRDLLLPEGAFASAEDADSEGEEGRFYLWDKAEVDRILPADQALLLGEALAIRSGGNFNPEHGAEPSGRNIPYLPRPLPETALALGIAPGEAATRLEAARQILLQVRNKRTRPLRDDKILADWNGLMIAALAKAARAFNEPRYADAARRAAAFVLSSLRTADGRLLHRYRDKEAAIPAFADDYAFMTWGLLELYEATLDSALLGAAIRLTESLLGHFSDALGGIYLSSDDVEQVLVRTMEVYDGAIPSANSVTLANMVRLARITGEARYEHQARRLASVFAGAIDRAPSAHTMFLLGLDHLLHGGTDIVIAGRPGSSDTDALLEVVRGRFLPAATLMVRPVNPPDLALESLAPALVDKAPINGRAAAYVCRDRTCLPPVTEPTALADLLGADAVAAKPASTS
ncbi:thioredoxin domain-containing protein [Candidatus Fermentibacteria bacterium]|nr:thioredoxin domain-containing protein [Candidatus Fermentibacteria bacterium]